MQGLSQSDSYATVRAKADSLYDDMAATMGVNTVRLPVNTHTVAATSWWNAYRGAIDAATARGFKVILAYWEDGAASGGRITNLAAWNAMWSAVTGAYGSNGNVYFEPMNEPHGYSSAEWRDVAAGWLARHTAAPPARVLIGGTGYSQDLRDICNDSRFGATLLSFHHYAFFYSPMTYDAFRSHIQTRLGGCASRAVATEFGAPMSTGLDYADAGSADNFVRHIRAMAQVMRDNQMGGTYWPALGGKPGDIGYDWYSMYALSGSGTDLRLTVRNASGADRIRYGWGDTITPTPPPVLLHGRRAPQRQGHGRAAAEHRRRRARRPVRRQRRRLAAVALPGRRRRLLAPHQPAQRQVPRRGERLDRRRRRAHPIHLRQRRQPAVPDGRRRRLLRAAGPAQRQVRGRAGLLDRRRRRPEAVRVQRRRQPAVVPHTRHRVMTPGAAAGQGVAGRHVRRGRAARRVGAGLPSA
ncbi:hypothetical protein GCM10020001_115080 [Nonomuraea salmonea]